MTEQNFVKICRKLEASGWVVDTYEPLAKFAIYRKDGRSQTVGNRKGA